MTRFIPILWAACWLACALGCATALAWADSWLVWLAAFGSWVGSLEALSRTGRWLDRKLTSSGPARTL